MSDVPVPVGMVDIAEIKIPPGRARKEFTKNAMDELVTSIRAHGIISPLCLERKQVNGSTELHLLAGERRFRASLQLAAEDPKFRLVPYTWKENLSDVERAKIELDENLRRDNLTEHEKNALYDRIIRFESETRGTTRGDPNAFKLSEITEKTGDSPSTISIRAKFHREIAEGRPDIFEKVKDKPFWTAVKEAERIQEAERAQQAMDIGQIVINQDYKQGDSRELIKTIPDNSVDLVLSDFPFAIPDLVDSQSDAQLYTGLMKHSDNLTTKEVDAFTREMAPQLFRILKPGSYMAIFFGWDCYAFTLHYLRSVGFEVDSEPVIWDKQSTTGSFKGYSPAPCYEQLLWCVKPPREKRMNEPMQRLLRYPVVKKDLRTHVFEKPVALLSEIIKKTTKIGDTVYDCCAGTGSTLLAGIELKRTVIGHELDPHHHALGCVRIHELTQRLQGAKS